MPNTPILALPYPAATDPADVPADIKKLADRLEIVVPGQPKAWSGSFIPVAGGAMSAALTPASGRVPFFDSGGNQLKIPFTPPVAGTFTFEVRGACGVNDSVWTRAEAIAQILKTSDSTPLVPETFTEIYGKLTDNVQYPSFSVKNRCAVAAGVPIYGFGAFLSVVGTWNYWQTSGYLRAFADFVPS